MLRRKTTKAQPGLLKRHLHDACPSISTVICDRADAFDHLSLGVRVCVHVGPLFRGEFAFRLLVAASMVDVSAQWRANPQASRTLGTLRGVDVNVTVLFRSPEHPMPIPFRLSHPQDIPRRF